MSNDLDLLVQNYQLLLDNYDKIKNMPLCIVHHTIKVSACCGQGSSIDEFCLLDLLDAWKNGYNYNGYPVIQSVGNNGSVYTKYIKDGKIETIENTYIPYLLIPDNFKTLDEHNYITLQEVISRLSLTEQLILKYKQWILNNKYQNTIYKNMPLWEYLGSTQKSDKKAPELNDLIDILLNQTIPCLEYFDLMTNKNHYKQYGDLYIRYNNLDDYIQINAFYNHFENISDENYIIAYYKPKMFEQGYHLKFLNNKLEKVDKNDVRLKEFRKMFKTKEEIFNLNIDISRYDKLK